MRLHPLLLLQQRVESGYKGNTGEGLFSFEQISQLVTAFPYEYEGSDVIDELTPKDIGKIVETHVAGASDAIVFTKARHELAGKFNMKDKPVKLVTNKDFPYDAFVHFTISMFIRFGLIFANATNYEHRL